MSYTLRQRDLFETRRPAKSLSPESQVLMLGLLEALLTEALAEGCLDAEDTSEEASDEQDHA